MCYLYTYSTFVNILFLKYFSFSHRIKIYVLISYILDKSKIKVEQKLIIVKRAKFYLFKTIKSNNSFVNKIFLI